ncbi:Uncharacterised protein [Mycobacteroides abscessus subsp. massiliense]|nr:Uncharacterised protein [Mycobacteroides abscessus subsp. massiliense]
MFLDYKRTIVTCLRFDGRYRFGGARRIAHAAVRRQPVFDNRHIIEPCQQITVTLGARQYFIKPQLAQFGSR